MLCKIKMFAFLLFIFWSCENGAKPVAHKDAGLQLDSLPGSSPYITKDTEGNLVISWAKALNDSMSIFCYAKSMDGGRSFKKTISVPVSTNIQPHSENLPKIIFKPSGEIIALWGAANPTSTNKYSGLVHYSQSFDEGATWSTPLKLVTDTNGYDQRYFDVDLLSSGEAAIIWLDNRKSNSNEGSALFFATTNGRNGFQNEKRIADGCCQCCRTDLFIDGSKNIHVLYRGIIKDSIRDMLHSVSYDGGNNFSVPRLISEDNWIIKGCPHTGPSMTENRDGLHFAWFTGGSKKGCFYNKSLDNGNNFIQQERISAAGSHPQITSFKSGDLIIAWDEVMLKDGSANKRIGVQKRNPAGFVVDEKFITPATEFASYPVVSALNDGNCFVAYMQRKHDRDYIFFQKFNFNN